MLIQALALALAATAPGPAPCLAVPPWPLSPDGELVAAPAGVPLVVVAGGSAEPVAPGLWRVLPARDAAEVTLRAGAERAVAPVEPPARAIELTWTPASPVKGRDEAVLVEVAIPPEAGAEPPRLLASAGRLEPLERIGPGRFRARYTPPATRQPEVVALFAVAPRCPTCTTPAAFGAARLPLAAAIDLPGETDPGVSTYVELAGTVFGPVTADQAGRFRLPVVVPPGVSQGVARSVSALGNERLKPIDLGLPPAPRLACLALPDRLPADGAARAAITCLAWTATGEADPAAGLELAAARGTVLGQWRDGGLVRAGFQAPRGGAGAVEVVATWREAGRGGLAAVKVELVTGGPAQIDWSVEGEPLRPGEAALASAVARDERGEPLGPAHAEGPHAGEVAAGGFRARSDLGDGLDPVTLAFALPPAPPAEVARLSLRRDGLDWVAEARAVDGRPAQGVALRFGGGARAITDERGEARLVATGPAETVTGPVGLRTAAWGWAPPPPAPAALVRRVVVSLRPPDAVDVAAGFDGRAISWVVRGAGGEPDPARAVLLRPGAVRLGPPQRQGGGWRAEVLGGQGPVGVIDAESGSAAVVEVR